MARRCFPSSRLHEIAAESYIRNPSSSLIPKRRITTLDGHNKEVYICAWNPQRDILASSSADATVRLWDRSRRQRPTDTSNHTTLTHFVDRHGNETDEREDVSAMEWSPDGTHLLTSSCHGYARIWDCSGHLKKDLFEHKQSILAVRWNKSSTRLLTASDDKSVIMWHANTGIVSQKFKFHKASVLDVDWQNDTRFASCSVDNKIQLCELDQYEPIHTFEGHTDEVNSVRWDPQGKLLASCSDDNTVKLWSEDAAECVRNMTYHINFVNMVRWSPTGPMTSNPNARLHLASASFDSSIRLWDAETGECTQTLRGHTDSVNTMAFSPDGRFIASGGLDQCVRICSVESGKLLQTYEGSGIIFEVSWNSDGMLLSACSSDGAVIVIDLRS